MYAHKQGNLLKQRLHIVLGQRLEETGFTGDDAFYQSAFLFLQLQNLFFHRSTGDDLVNEDGLILPNAMGSVAGLHFNGGIPPRVEMNDVIGGGQVQPYAARF